MEVMIGKSERLAHECAGCMKARDYICCAIVDPIGMWKECGDCFASTTDKGWYDKYDRAVNAYKIKKNFKKKKRETITARSDKECVLCSQTIWEEEEYYVLPVSQWSEERRHSIQIRLPVCIKCGDGLNQDYIL